MLPHSTNNNTRYTCLSCQIQFASTDLQRMHMKTEWHRYNLKRRVAQLAPVSNEIFQVKVAHIKDQIQYDEFGFIIEEPKNKPKKKEKNTLRYDLLNRGREKFINKPFNSTRDDSPAGSEISEISTGAFSLGTLKSHSDFEYDTDDIRSEISHGTLNRNKIDSDYHTDDYNTEDYPTDYDQDVGIDEEEEEDDDEPLELNDCFYCGTKFENINNNLNHMTINHGLYIPEIKYLEDKDGLIRLLSDTVVLDKECIKCGFHSNKLLGIRQHIIAKGHACIPYETKEERLLFKRFYNFGIKEEEKQEGNSDKELEENFKDDFDDDEGEFTTALIDSSGVELSLPNGSRLGHRSMTRYYRQNFPRSDRRLSEGERTISIINQENEKLAHLQETAKHNKEIKKLSIINNKITNKQLSTNSLQYQNNLEHYRNQRFG